MIRNPLRIQGMHKISKINTDMNNWSLQTESCTLQSDLSEFRKPLLQLTDSPIPVGLYSAD